MCGDANALPAHSAPTGKVKPLTTWQVDFDAGAVAIPSPAYSVFSHPALRHHAHEVTRRRLLSLEPGDNDDVVDRSNA